jgi:hypothetical protein
MMKTIECGILHYHGTSGGAVHRQASRKRSSLTLGRSVLGFALLERKFSLSVSNIVIGKFRQTPHDWLGPPVRSLPLPG